jgi:hypothetical protein
MSARHRLGDWTAPSGNNVIVYLRRDAQGLVHIDMEWDEPPPLRAADELFYIAEIIPAINRLVREFTETPGDPTVWVRP